MAVDVGASIGWGLIDGFTNLMGESIDRGGQAELVRKIQEGPASDQSVAEVVGALDGTFISRFTEKSKREIATKVIENSPGASTASRGFATREDIAGLFSILGIYLAAGVALSAPYLIFRDKLAAWLVSNVLGIAWLFFYGYTVGEARRPEAHTGGAARLWRRNRLPGHILRGVRLTPARPRWPA